MAGLETDSPRWQASCTSGRSKRHHFTAGIAEPLHEISPAGLGLRASGATASSTRPGLNQRAVTACRAFRHSAPAMILSGADFPPIDTENRCSDSGVRARKH